MTENVYRWFDHNGQIVSAPATKGRPTAYPHRLREERCSQHRGDQHRGAVVTDPISWLRQQLNTVEQLAFAAMPIQSSASIIDEDGPRAVEEFARVVRQVQAHRAILDAYVSAQADADRDFNDQGVVAYADGLRDAVRDLLLIYSDRPGYTEATGGH